jgi:hypothetical protein
MMSNPSRATLTDAVRITVASPTFARVIGDQVPRCLPATTLRPSLICLSRIGRPCI